MFVCQQEISAVWLSITRHRSYPSPVMGRPPLATKPCVSCGRVITWRKKWERNWDEVRYCSDACRSRKVSSIDQSLGETILSLLSTRQPTASICPSDAARIVGGEQWRDLMEPARAAARRLVNEGRVEITQQGRTVDPSTAKGPIRIRLTETHAEPSTGPAPASPTRTNPKSPQPRPTAKQKPNT
jgi:hypothetical protein